jgi:hypothetical protein
VSHGNWYFDQCAYFCFHDFYNIWTVRYSSVYYVASRSRWYISYRTYKWTQCSRVQSWPRKLDFDDKIRSKTSFGRESCARFYGMLKIPWRMIETLIGKISGHFSPGFSSPRFYMPLLQPKQIILEDESRMIRTQMGSKIYQKCSQCKGRFVRYHPVTVASMYASLVPLLKNMISSLLLGVVCLLLLL